MSRRAEPFADNRAGSPAGAADLLDVPPSLLEHFLDSRRDLQGTAQPPRHEFKLTTSHRPLYEVLSWLRLHRSCFRPAHPPRRVNNVYFDTPDLSSYSENVDGMVTRRKLRLRWYGHDLEAVRGTMEAKCKRGLCGWKLKRGLRRPKDLTRLAWNQVLQAIHGDLPPAWQQELAVRCSPVLFNRYERSYFTSMDDQVRVTVDSSPACGDQRMSGRPNLHRLHPLPHTIVIEVKAPLERRDELVEIVSQFPLRVSKHSKYQSAVEALLAGAA